MPLNGSGPISIGGSTAGQSINLEFGRAAGATTSMSQLYRNGGIVGSGAPNVPTSGAISLSQFYGAANQFAFTISTNQTNANLRTLAVNAGWDQSAPVVATINSGIFISSNSTATPALTINGSFPGGVSLINNGTIAGMGGAGGAGGGRTPGSFPQDSTVGAPGGLALSVASAVSINNIGTIRGGGGGGGGGGCGSFEDAESGSVLLNPEDGGGSGGGGGTGLTNSSGGAIAAQALAGAAGTSAGAGAGGAGGNVRSLTRAAGGSAGGGNGGSISYQGGGGGGGGTFGGAGGTGGSNINLANTSQSIGRAGGSGGAAVSGNSNITWVATGTRLGAIA